MSAALPFTRAELIKLARLLGTLSDAVECEGLWAPVLVIAERMAADQIEPIAQRLLDEGLEDQLPALLAVVEETNRWETGLRLLAGLSPEFQQRLAAVAGALRPEERTRALERARAHGLLKELDPIADALVA